MDNADVVKRIEIKLSEIGMSKAEFYKKAGISSATYSQWNTGKFSPSVKKLKGVADCLGVTVEYLMGQEKEEPQVGNLELKDVIETYIEREKMRLLFHSTKELSDDEIDAAIQVIKLMTHTKS